MEKEKVRTDREIQEEKADGTVCKDARCPFHGELRARGRVFYGYVKKKFPKRVVIEFERTTYVRKYERYTKGKTRIHASLPSCVNVDVGDYIKVQECRPLSKIIHFVVMEKIRSKGEKFHEQNKNKIRSESLRIR